MPTIQEINRELADKLYQEAQQNPQSPYAGKKVGIANGQVIVVADDWDTVDQKLDETEPDASRTFVADMTHDYKKVEYIWGLTDGPHRLAVDACKTGNRNSANASAGRKEGFSNGPG